MKVSRHFSSKIQFDRVAVDKYLIMPAFKRLNCSFNIKECKSYAIFIHKMLSKNALIKVNLSIAPYTGAKNMFVRKYLRGTNIFNFENTILKYLHFK